MTESSMIMIPYSRFMAIRNIGNLPRGLGAPYLVVIRGQGSDFVAKRWLRKMPESLEEGEILLVMTTSKE